jgi:hypothetical protein
MHRDLGGGVFDLTKIVGRKFDCSCSDVFFQAMQLRGARDWNNPRPLSEQPPERDLSRGCLLPFCDAAEEFNQRLVRLERLRREARESAAEVSAVELRVFVDLAREKAFAQRAVGNEADSQFLESRYDFLLRSSGPERVFALKCGERLDGCARRIVCTPASERPKCFTFPC